MKGKLPAINIQFPISQEILSGTKVVETRTYPIPGKYLNKKMWLVETPGKDGDFEARVVAEITFSDSFKYKSKAEFEADVARHRVDQSSPWAWKTKGPDKWGWTISEINVLRKPKKIKGRRGIVFTKELELGD